MNKNQETNSGTTSGTALDTDSKQKRVRTALTPQLIVDILKDRYHNHLGIREIREKYHIGNKVWGQINKEHKQAFIAKFGVKEKKKNTIAVSKEAMQTYLDTVESDDSEDIITSKELKQRKIKRLEERIAKLNMECECGD